MRTLSVALLALTIALVAGSAVFAEDVCVPAAPTVSTTTTQPCPVPPTPASPPCTIPQATAPCPAPCPAPTQAACPPAPCGPTCTPAVVCSVPAGAGAGPVVELANIPRGNEFDSAYSRLAYQQHADIISLATLGAQQAVDPNLRKFSAKVVDERTKMNDKLNMWYPRFVCNEALSLNSERCTQLTSEFANMTGCDFDNAYVATLLSLMQQENRIANDGTFKASYGGLRDQANLVKRVSYNEIRALENWQTSGVLKK